MNLGDQHILAAVTLTLFLAGCSTSSVKITTPSTTTPVGRMSIPQEQVQGLRQIAPKITPASYHVWLDQADNRERAQQYEDFLERNNVANIVPYYELFRTARDWQRCERSEYMVPNRELWNNAIPTLRVLKYLVAAQILTDFEVTSVYRDLPLNECAGGAPSSRHLFNSAIDFRIGPSYPQPEDLAYIEHSKSKLCQFWQQHGESLQMGLGLYASGQIHIDTQGYRTWGPDHSRASSLCNGLI